MTDEKIKWAAWILLADLQGIKNDASLELDRAEDEDDEDRVDECEDTIAAVEALEKLAAEHKASTKTFD